ncbi:ABC transporter ATP-binding protein [Geminocystis sp. NIES-3709]|uniref:ABC transporter ATP-binding protein n=1 Tax=Geminocystis sp. NIES-3709 TaxID=1617448 RepID=UPI0005FC61FC|nr:ATP-binding cassette domain-containing protein [Geminocystis sp. NIES-3709]BAQ64763.1 methionine ABC transporter ATP-binding protein [Geminocystis sp. NIES-3709]
MVEPIIELRGVCKAFGDNIILDQANLKIYPNDALVIIGPSGTGKSTILRLIAGLTEPDDGEIYVKGEKRIGLIEDHRELMAISMVFQQAALFDSLTVRENVGFSLYEHSGLSRSKIGEIVDRTLEMVGLSPETANLFPAELSGGMRKRVSFARAIIFNPDKPEERPEVVLYDEPTAGLDPIASTVVENLVRSLQKNFSSCNSYVMVSHQNSTIRRTGERLVFLYEGKFQWEGHINEIDTTENALVRQFFNASTEGPIK